MRREQWEVFKAVAKGRWNGPPPVALIVDSPWIPGHAGLGHLDYYLDPEAWFQANLGLLREFPEVIFLPSWWVEYGMAAEPGAVGSRITFWPDQPPAVAPAIARIEDVERLEKVNPSTDGLMALALHRYRKAAPRIREAGYIVPMVASRGPVCTAAFLRGVTDFMTDLVDNPEAAHKLLEFTTGLVIDWLRAQAEAAGDTVDGILVLDDIVGFLSRPRYLDFAAPYLKRITAAFPAEWVKVYHNDANIRPFAAELPDTGFDVLNWSHNLDVADAMAKTGGRLRLMGNVAPLDVGVRGTPQQVKAAALEVLGKTGRRDLILSMGGGVSTGTPSENIRALVEAAREFAGRLID
jgi:MtaA/CmuA family methyltransferase